jgi:hypothetical protein
MPEASSSSWFRQPNRREHCIAAALFVGFGVFFVFLFLLQRGWWFRWVILGLGAISILRGLGHVMDAIRGERQ